MNKCFFSHCWHKIPNTERTIIRKDDCKRIGETIVQHGGFAYYKVDKECCRCDKKRTIILDDYDINRARKFPTEKEYIHELQTRVR